MKVTIKIKPQECILAANCTGVAPRFFEIGAEPYVELFDGKGGNQGMAYSFEPTPEELELLHEAADSCPTRAIEVVEGA